MQTNTSPTSVKLSQPLRERVKNLADARNQSAHAVMLLAIESYVDREEKREKLRQEALAAHEHFMITGLHLTGEEVNLWLDELADGRDVEPTKCHI